MSGENDLNQLLANLHPIIHPGIYVFCTFPPDSHIDPGFEPVCTFREEEGLTIIAAQSDADRFGWSYDYLAGWITLQVHSDLAAVGLTAQISTALAAAEISCNIVAGYFHDHLFVPIQQVDAAMLILSSLTNQTQAK